MVSTTETIFNNIKSGCNLSPFNTLYPLCIICLCTFRYLKKKILFRIPKSILSIIFSNVNINFWIFIYFLSYPLYESWCDGKKKSDKEKVKLSRVAFWRGGGPFRRHVFSSNGPSPLPTIPTRDRWSCIENKNKRWIQKKRDCSGDKIKILVFYAYIMNLFFFFIYFCIFEIRKKRIFIWFFFMKKKSNKPPIFSNLNN